MSDNNHLNDNYLLNNNYVPIQNNPVYENPVANEAVVIEPVDTHETVEERHEEHIEQMQQVTTPVAAVPAAPVLWLKQEEIAELQARWTSIQSKFVDEPRGSVEQADALVLDALERIEKVFASERTTLRQQWGSHADTSTEDLRTALKSYRSFFNRILTL